MFQRSELVNSYNTLGLPHTTPVLAWRDLKDKKGVKIVSPFWGVAVAYHPTNGKYSLAEFINKGMSVKVPEIYQYCLSHDTVQLVKGVQQFHIAATVLERFVAMFEATHAPRTFPLNGPNPSARILALAVVDVPVI